MDLCGIFPFDFQRKTGFIIYLASVILKHLAIYRFERLLFLHNSESLFSFLDVFFMFYEERWGFCPKIANLNGLGH